MTPQHPYQDAALDVDQRVADLLSRMDLADKAGLLFQPMADVGDFDRPGTFGTPSVRTLLQRRITQMNVLEVSSARETAEWHNALQRAAREHPLGIPVTISSDPRHSFTDNPAAAFLAGPFSQWPEPLGFAALGSAELVERFAEVTRREYLAVGIRTALHPQLDLATEPRWARQNGTFGEDADTVARLGAAYVRGLQGPAGAGVSAMVKHFPGGGPQRDGEDPHFPYGREQVYPGGCFDQHLEPFRAVIDAGAAQVMPYYGMPVGTELEEVGFGFSRQVLTGLLREDLGFDGIVCSDWGILSDMCWGVEHLSHAERMRKALEAGIDQFGGESSTDVLISLVESGAVSERRLDSSARRVLREKFRLGLFDDPFVDAGRAAAVVGAADAREQGLEAQAAAHALVQNTAGSAAGLPLRSGIKVYAENVDPAALRGRAQSVGSPEEADVAILRLTAPWEQRGTPGDLESFFRAGSLAWSAEELDRIGRIAAAVPTAAVVHLDRPALLGPLAEAVSALVVEFGACDEAVARVLFGEAEPRGRLPFDIPSSAEAVAASRPDVAFDTAEPAYRFGHGLRYG